MAKSISKNAIFKAMLNLFNIILPIMVIPLVTRAVGPELYGFMGYGDSLTAYFLIFASFGIYQYGLREISKVRDDEKKLRQTFTSLCLFSFFTNIVVSIAYMVFVWVVYRDKPYMYTCMIMGFNLVFNMFYVEWVNEALENYDFIAIKTMIVRIIYSALILLYIVVGFNFINNIISFIYVKKRIKFDFSHLQFMKHIKPMFYVVILSNTGVLYTQLDKIMIESNSGTTDVGYYYTAQRIMTIINTLMLTVIQVTMPRLSNYLGNESKEEYLKLLKRVIKIYFLFLFPASIGLLCLSKEAIYMFGGSQFLPAVPVMMVFSIYMLSIGVESVIANQMIYLHGKERDDAVLILIGGVINLVLNFLLVVTGTFSMVTAIITTLISNLIVIVLEYRLVRKVIKLDIHLFSYENMKYLLYSLVFIPITFIIKNIISNIFIACILEVAVSSIVYVAILILTKDSTFMEMTDKILVKFKIKR